MLKSSVSQGCGWCLHEVQNPAPLLEIVHQVLLFSTVPGLPILSASEMHLLHLSQKIPCSPQPKVACLSPGPRGCPAEKDMVPDVMGETRRGLALIPIPCLHEQVVPSAGASC